MILKLKEHEPCPYIDGRMQLSINCINCCYNHVCETCHYENFSDAHHERTKKVSSDALSYIVKHPKEFPAYHKYKERQKQTKLELLESANAKSNI